VEYDVATTDEFDGWLDEQAADVRELVATRILRVQSGLLGDHKALGDKVSELRIHSGPGYRLYYTVSGRVLIILLVGALKRDQKKDLKRAKALAASL
jgi:putative addiction module killer protein